MVKGRKWIDAQGWKIKDVYVNTTRDDMPARITIGDFGATLCALARRSILANGGTEVAAAGPAYHIAVQRPANVEPLPRPLDRGEPLRRELLARVDKDLSGDDTARARAAYLAVCLGEAERYAKQRPDDWRRALDLLKQRRGLIRAIKEAVPPTAQTIQKRAAAAGLLP